MTNLSPQASVTLGSFNAAPAEAAERDVLACCASKTFAKAIARGAYFTARGLASFYPEVTITFEMTAPDEHYHVPLLLSPYAYSTYRGS